MSDKDRLNKRLVIIGGPTASGKTEAAIELAQQFHSEIVNADSRQVYKELNIGVGKPRPDQLSVIPHHLISFTTIHQHYSAGHFATDALTMLYSLFAQHDIVLLVGGTGLYIKSVMEGFDSMPEVPEKVTQHWLKIWEEKGNQPLIDALAELDPDYLAVVDPDNHSRLIRAVAVSDHTGQPFSSYRKGEKADRFFKIIPVALDLPRKELYERINQRVLDMIRQGWLEEAKELYPHRHLKALQTVGYKELFEVIDGKMTMEEAIPKIQQATRRYAKRQLTWFRNQGQWKWISPGDLKEIKDLITLSSLLLLIIH